MLVLRKLWSDRHRRTVSDHDSSLNTPRSGERKTLKLKKGHNSKKKMHCELSPFIVWIALWVVSTNSSFKYLINIFSKYKDITKWQSFCTMTMPRLQQYLRFSPKTAKLKMKVSINIQLMRRS